MINGFAWLRNLAILTVFIVLGWASAQALVQRFHSWRRESGGNGAPRAVLTIAELQPERSPAKPLVLAASKSFSSPDTRNARPEILTWTQATSVVTHLVARPHEPLSDELRSNDHPTESHLDPRWPARDKDVLRCSQEWSQT